MVLILVMGFPVLEELSDYRVRVSVLAYTIKVIGAIYSQAHDGEARQALMPLCSVVLGIPP